MIVQPESRDYCAEPACLPLPATPTGSRCGAKGVIDADIQIVAAAVGGSNKMKILVFSGQIGQWNVRQQARRDRADLCDRVVQEISCQSMRVENLEPAFLLRTRCISGLREISLPLE